MFDKRLLAMVPQARRFIIADVALQWIGLLANIILLFLIGAFLQSSLAGEADAQGALALIGAAAAAIVVRMACQSGAQIMGQKAATAAKQTVRSEVYGKLVKLGPAYSESVATAEAVQVCVEGTGAARELLRLLPAPTALRRRRAAHAVRLPRAREPSRRSRPARMRSVHPRFHHGGAEDRQADHEDLLGLLHRSRRAVPREHPGSDHPQDLPSRRAAPPHHERRGGELPPRHHEPAQDAA